MDDHQLRRVLLVKTLYAGIIFLVLLIVSNWFGALPGTAGGILPGLAISTLVRIVMAAVAVYVLWRSFPDVRSLVSGYVERIERRSLEPFYSPFMADRLTYRSLLLLYALLTYVVAFPPLAEFVSGLPGIAWLAPLTTVAFIILIAIVLYSVFKDVRQLANRFTEGILGTSDLNERIVCSSCGIALAAGTKQCPACGSTITADASQPGGSAKD